MGYINSDIQTGNKQFVIWDKQTGNYCTALYTRTVHHNQAYNTDNGGDSCLLMGSLSVLEEFSHVLVDQVRSILLYPVTAVRDVPVGREGGEERDRGRGWRDGNHIPLHNDISLVSYFTVRLVTIEL